MSNENEAFLGVHPDDLVEDLHRIIDERADREIGFVLVFVLAVAPEVEGDYSEVCLQSLRQRCE